MKKIKQTNAKRKKPFII